MAEDVPVTAGLLATGSLSFESEKVTSSSLLEVPSAGNAVCSPHVGSPAGAALSCQHLEDALASSPARCRRSGDVCGSPSFAPLCLAYVPLCLLLGSHPWFSAV